MKDQITPFSIFFLFFHKRARTHTHTHLKIVVFVNAKQGSVFDMLIIHY